MSDHFLKWYPENAMTSPRWRRLSLEQKGLFHELYDFAATCDPRGTLSTNGFPMTGTELAHYFGLDEDRFSALFLPMTHPSLSLIVQSSKKRFMFPDWPRHQRSAPFRTRHAGAEVAREWREIGALEVIESKEDTDMESKKKRKKTLARLVFPPNLNTEKFLRAWTEWAEYRDEIRKPLTFRAAEMQVKRLAEVGSAVAIQAIETSIANQWQGLFPEKEKRGGQPNQKGTGGDKPAGSRYRESRKVEA